MEITLNVENILSIAAVVAEVVALFGVIFAIYRWYLRQNKQDEEIKKIKQENTLICYGLSAALDGLIQLGANHGTQSAKEKLDKHLNQQAHE